MHNASEPGPALPNPLSPPFESRPGLLRALGPGMATAIVVGNVIGAGIFAKPGIIAAEARDFDIIWRVWLAAGVICLLGSLCYAELAVMLPRAGGAYVYLREAYGRPVGFLYGWNDFLFGRPASIGALSTFFALNLAQFVGWNAGEGARLTVALSTIALMAVVNIAGVIWGGRMQGVTTALKVGLLLVVAGLPVAFYLAGSTAVDPGNFALGLRQDHDPRLAGVLLSVIWAYHGWEGITPVAEEIRDPPRNNP